MDQNQELKLKITEEPSKDSTIFYIREQPYIPGRSIQATALTFDAAIWLSNKIKGLN